MLSSDEELQMVEWIKLCSSRGYPQSARAIRMAAGKIVKHFPRNNDNKIKFRRCVPTHSWFVRFMARYPELKLRKPEALKRGSATVAGEDLVGWSAYLKERNLAHILDEPERILGGDETGVEFNQDPAKVVIDCQSKNALNCETSETMARISVMHTVG